MITQDHDTGSGACLTGAGKTDLGREAELLSHDIRAAVSDVIGGLRLIEMNDISDGLRAQLSGVQSASEVLARLVEDALLLMTGERPTAFLGGNLHLHRLFQDMSRRWQMRASSQGVRFSLLIGPDVPEVVTLDRLAMERILANLIGNAIKYAGNTWVMVDVTLDADRAIRCQVCDNGLGFSDVAQANLFAPHSRTGDGGPAGTGLGLHISKQSADMLGADLIVANRPEGGACVQLVLPYASWHGNRAARGSLPDLSAYKILVADDSHTNQLLVSQMLAAMGAECELADDGVEALNWLARETFDLVLIDVEMPRLSGLDVLRTERMRQKQGLNQPTPLVAMTAYVMRDNREAIYTAGADGLLAKPLVSIESFGHAVLHYITAHRDAGAGLPDPAATGDADADVPVFETATLDDLLMIAGPDSAHELMRRLRDDLRGVEAGITEGLATGSLPAIRTHTHVLISLSAAVGAVRLQQLAQSLNTCARTGPPECMRKTGDAVLMLLRDLRALLAAYPVPYPAVPPPAVPKA